MEVSSMAGGEKTRQGGYGKSKGGFKAIPFIIANEVCERIASVGLLANMIIYLTQEYHMKPAAGANLLFSWSAITNFTPVLGALLSDFCLGRFRVIMLGSFLSFSGILLLWLTAALPGAKPGCSFNDRGCVDAKGSQLALLLGAFALMAVGAGGIRPCSLAFGADQLNHRTYANKERVMQTYFNWYYASVGVAIVVAVTVIVYLQDSKGYAFGFAVALSLMLCAALLLILGSSLYVKVDGDRSIVAGLARVLVLSYRNRNRDNRDLHIPSPSPPATDKLRFLNKATLGDDACSIEQVEDVKSVIGVLPIWSTGLVMAVVIGQVAFPVLQASTMDRHLGPSFQIPPGSFAVFSILTLTLWVAVYDVLIVPWLSKLTDRPRGLSLKQRMGVGLALSVLAMATAACTESYRRREAIKQGVQHDPRAVLSLSALWLLPQFCLTGLAEAFNIIGQIEFYYSELPESMASIGIAIFSAGLGIGNLLGSLIVTVVNRVTGGNGRVSWLSSNLNEGRYDYYYWIIAILSAINFLYYLLCSWAYGEEGTKKKKKIFTQQSHKEEKESKSKSMEEKSSMSFN